MSRQTLLVLILEFAAATLAAQQVPISQPVDSGTVVRLGWRGGPKQIGQLVAPLTPESDAVLYCRYPGPPCAKGSSFNPEARPTRDLLSVELRRGDRAGRGALLGVGVGIAVFALGRWAFADADSPAPLTGQRVAGGVTFVAIAAGIGALIGRGSARWVSVP